MRIEEKEYTKSIDISIWKKVFPFLAPRKNVLIMVIVMNILCSAVDIIMPLFQRQAIDSFIAKNTLAGLGGFIALYIAVIVFQMWSVICFTRGCMTLDVETGRDMKRALFVHLQKLSFSYYNATPVGYILSRVMNDVARITELIAWDVIDMLWAIFYVVGVFVAMLFLNWKLALVIMLIEADGAKRKPLKVPADWEPAIPDFADVVVSVIGLDCLGKPICETAHRAEYTSSFLEKNLEAPVTAEDIEKIATSVHGLYKNVDHKVYRVYLNKADILPDSSPAEHIVEDLAKQGTIAAYGSLREAEKL